MSEERSGKCIYGVVCLHCGILRWVVKGERLEMAEFMTHQHWTGGHSNMRI